MNYAGASRVSEDLDVMRRAVVHPVAGNFRVNLILAYRPVTRYAVTRYSKSYSYGTGS